MALLKILFTQDHMGLKSSKCYCSYRFHPMSVKLYEDHAVATMVEYRLLLSWQSTKF